MADTAAVAAELERLVETFDDLGERTASAVVRARLVELLDLVWVVVDDYGDGKPCTGVFDSYDDAAGYAPHEDRFVPCLLPRASLAEAA